MDDPGPYYRPPGMGYAQRPRHIHWLPIVIGGVLVVVAALILLMLLDPASFGLGAPSSPYGFGRFGGVFALFFILIVVFFVVRVAFWSTRTSRYGRRYDPDRSEGYGSDRPAMIARMRYARGEITREQYDQIMKDLGRRPGSP
jgi:putative membrane protein